MFIGEVIQDLERSDDERKRIIGSIVSRTGSPFVIFSKYADKIDDLDFWTRVHKSLHINGFRPGKAKQLALTKLQDLLAKNDPSSIKPFWNCYKICIVESMTKDYPRLNSVLANCEYKDDNQSTEHIFKAICKYVDLYEVKEIELEHLYEIFWFKRTGKFKEIISERVIDLEVVKKLLEKQEKTLTSRIKKTDDSLHAVDKKLQSLEDELHSTTEKAGNNYRNVEQIIKETRKEIIDLIEKIPRQTTVTVKPNERIVGKEIEDKIEKFENRQSKLNSSLSTEIREIKASIEKLNEKPSSPNIAFLDGLNGSNLWKEFPGIIQNITKDARPGSISSDFFSEVILSQELLYIEEENLFRTLFQKHIKDNKAIVISASPADLVMEDITKLIVEQYKNPIHETLVIRNFDLGFIEGYLLPLIHTFKTWFPSLKRLIILPSNECNEFFCSKVLGDFTKISSECLIAISAMAMLPEKQPANAAEFNYPQDCVDLRKYIFNLQIKIPDRLFDIFCSTYSKSKQYFEESKCLKISYLIILKPYICSKYGSIKDEVVNEFLKDF